MNHEPKSHQSNLAGKNGKKLGVPPELLRDALIGFVREQDESGNQKLEDWLNAGEQALQQNRALLEEVRNSRVIAEEAVNAARFYVMHFEEEEKDASGGPT